MLIGEYVQQFEPGITDANNTANNALVNSQEALDQSKNAMTIATDALTKASGAVTTITSSQDGSTVKIIGQKNDASDTYTNLPVASELQAGVVNTATYRNLQELNSRVTSLESNTTTYIVVFPNDNPTQAEILNAYRTAYPLAPNPPLDGTTVIDVDKQLFYRYVKNGTVWIKTSGFNVTQFTNEVAGIIKGSITPGQIQAETDGTGSLVGYDNLTSGISANATEINSIKTSITGLQTKNTEQDTAINSVKSTADHALAEISVAPGSTDVKINQTRGNGITDVDSIPAVTTSLAGIVTPAMFNQWNKEEVIKYTTYNKFSWGSAANFTGQFRINNYLFTARSYYSSGGRTTLVIDDSVDDNFEVNTMQYIGPNGSPSSQSTSSLHYIGRLPGNTTLIGASTSAGNYRSYVGIVFINHLDSNMNVDAKAVILLSSYYPSSNRDIQVEIWTSNNWLVEQVATGGGPSIS